MEQLSRVSAAEKTQWVAFMSLRALKVEAAALPRVPRAKQPSSIPGAVLAWDDWRATGSWALNRGKLPTHCKPRVEHMAVPGFGGEAAVQLQELVSLAGLCQSGCQGTWHLDAQPHSQAAYLEHQQCQSMQAEEAPGAPPCLAREPSPRLASTLSC